MARGIYRVFRVEKRIPEGTAGVTLALDGCMDVAPGQFVMAWLPGIEERPFSVMDDAPLSLTVAQVGPFTRALCALRPGDRLWLRGPYGHGFGLVGRRQVIVAGGSGAASVALLAKRAREKEHDVTVVIGARTALQMMLAWHFHALGCAVWNATDDGSQGYHGTVVQALASLSLATGADGLYGCGPELMLRALIAYSRQEGLPCWVSLERSMKCGLGICGACHCGDRLICHDGPVFAAEEASRMLAVEATQSW